MSGKKRSTKTVKPALRWARVDEENGCEKCWDALRADLKAAGLAEPLGDEGLYPDSWVGRWCPHDAPTFAPSILNAKCSRCGVTTASVKVSATDLEGSLLDGPEAVCVFCAKGAGFEVGGGPS